MFSVKGALFNEEASFNMKWRGFVLAEPFDFPVNRSILELGPNAVGFVASRILCK